MKNNVIAYTSENAEFYPTPIDIVEKMLQNINWMKTTTFLEPSAGKGNIVDLIIKKAFVFRQGRYGKTGVSVDCVEIDKDLRGILEYKYSGSRLKELEDQVRPFRQGSYSHLTSEQKTEYHVLEEELDTLKNTDVKIVADDFLAFKTYKRYDVIIMNPPFSNGDEHLLHALEMQKNGGTVICLLNAETILNPYTNTRKLLKQKLDNYSAKIQFLKGAFSAAERKTDVTVALIEVVIPKKEQTSFIFDNLKRAKEQEKEKIDAKDVTSGNFIESIIEQYDFEVEGTLQLIREYEAMKPYMLVSFDKEGACGSILTLSLAKDARNYEQKCDVNEYLRIVRLKYWRALFQNKEFTGMLTKNLYEKYYNIVESMGDYDFTLYNIKTFQQKMMSELTRGVNDTILSLFDKLTEEHSWYPECSANIHYFNGWATNKAHMINTKKVILPMYGMYASSYHDGALNEYRAYEELSDIEKALNYLDTGEVTGPDLRDQINMYSRNGITKKIPLKYFWVTFYKKGTCHIEWRVPELVEKLNIYGCQKKKWLPPNYGKIHYTDMTAEEKTVIDAFQGAEAYEKVMANAEYYLAETGATSPLLLAGS